MAQEYGDKMNPFVVHNTPTNYTSSKVIVHCTFLLGFLVCQLYITKAFEKSKHEQIRNVCIEPKEEDRIHVKVSSNEVLRLHKQLHGI